MCDDSTSIQAFIVSNAGPYPSTAVGKTFFLTWKSAQNEIKRLRAAYGKDQEYYIYEVEIRAEDFQRSWPGDECPECGYSWRELPDPEKRKDGEQQFCNNCERVFRWKKNTQGDEPYEWLEALQTDIDDVCGWCGAEMLELPALRRHGLVCTCGQCETTHTWVIKHKTASWTIKSSKAWV